MSAYRRLVVLNLMLPEKPYKPALRHGERLHWKYRDFFGKGGQSSPFLKSLLCANGSGLPKNNAKN
jgi:hypothetical protein